MKNNVVFNYKKATQSLNFFARKKQDKEIDKLEVIKLVWLADRYHLRKYGRPIVGDEYWAMKNGPVPSAVKDFASKNECLDATEKDYDNQFIEKIDGYTIKSIKESELEVFSKSDIEALEFAYINFGDFGNRKLVNLSHRYPEWKKFENDLEAEVITRGPMNYLDFFSDPSDLQNDRFKDNKENLEESKKIYLEKIEQAELWQ